MRPRSRVSAFAARWKDLDVAPKCFEELNAVRVGREGKRAVRLENLGTYAIAGGAGEIHRENGKLTVAYSATVAGDPAIVRAKLDRTGK